MTSVISLPGSLRAANVAEQEQLKQDLLVTSSTVIALLGLIWGLVYLYFGAVVPAALPLGYAFLSFASIGYYALTGRYHLFRSTQLALTLIVPFLLMVVLGGFVNSSAVVLWSFTSPVGAMLFAGRRSAAGWFAAFLVLLVLGGLVDAETISLPITTYGNITGNLLIALFVMNLAGVSIVVFSLLAYFTRERDRSNEQLLIEQAKSEALLLNVLPESIARRLKSGEKTIAECFDEAGILFADLVGFTPLSAELGVERTVQLLNELLSGFDAIVERHGLEKIRTIGDGYMAAAGVPTPTPNYAHALADAALEMQAFIRSLDIPGDEPLHLRIGINTGTVMAGIIGRKKFSYDVWGDPVNVASRMESSSVADCIQISERVYQLLKDDYVTEPRGTVTIKGKGEMRTWFLISKQSRNRLK